MVKDVFYTATCKVCGKKFISSPEWVYKAFSSKGQRYLFCSWHCLQGYRKLHPARQKREADIISHAYNYYDLYEGDNKILHMVPAGDIKKALNLICGINMRQYAINNSVIKGKYRVTIVGQYTTTK